MRCLLRASDPCVVSIEKPTTGVTLFTLELRDTGRLMGREVERCPTGLEDRTQVGLGGVILKTIGSVFVLYGFGHNTRFTTESQAVCLWMVLYLRAELRRRREDQRATLGANDLRVVVADVCARRQC